MTRIDALGQPCPIPVVKAKNAIAALPAAGGVVQVLVDNAVACDNLAKMATGLGHQSQAQPQADGNYLVTITVGACRKVAGETAPAPAEPPPGAGLVAVIGADSMGRGSEELGKILIKGFIFSLSQLSPPPHAVVFFNSGVRLTLRDANTVADLRALADKGCRISICGTCADYYQCRDDIAVGEIVDMYGIVETMSAGRNVITI